MAKLKGTHAGDLEVPGKLLIRGTVVGDVRALPGSTVRITGTVTGDVVVDGGEVRVQGRVGGRLTVTAGSVSFAMGCVVNGKVLGYGGRWEAWQPAQADFISDQTPHFDSVVVGLP